MSDKPLLELGDTFLVSRVIGGSGSRPPLCQGGRMNRFALVILLCSTAAFGQIGTSTIIGRVTDASGAVVPNVSVVVVNTDTNFQFTAATNADGLFRVQSLQPGPYRVTFEAGGFKRLIRDAVELRASDT